jgi:hypothetical protein
MQVFFRHMLMMLCALALISGSALGLAVPPAMAGEPCPHEHSSGPTQHSHHHGIDGAGCLACCVGGICLAAPGLPARPASVVLPSIAPPITYWDASVAFSGRSLAPDPAPPKTSA